MNLVDDQGKQLGGGPKGFRFYDANGNLVQSAAGGGVGPAGPPGTNGTNGTNGVSVQWLGTFASAPGSPTLNQAYRNSTDGKAYIWSGSAWSEMVQDGATGATGPAGPGVPTGGTTGQVLAKIDATNYNTHWIPASGGATTSSGPYSSLPGSGTNAGDVYIMTDNPIKAVWNGSAWKLFWQHKFPMTPPPTTGWSWLNQGGATVDSSTGPVLRVKLTSNNIGRVFYRSPITAPFTYIFGIDVWCSNNASTNIGPVLCTTGGASPNIVAMNSQSLIQYTSGVLFSQNMGTFYQRFKVKLQDDGSGHWLAYVMIPESDSFDTGSSYWKALTTTASVSPKLVGLNAYADGTANGLYAPYFVLWDFQEVAGLV